MASLTVPFGPADDHFISVEDEADLCCIAIRKPSQRSSLTDDGLRRKFIRVLAEALEDAAPRRRRSPPKAIRARIGIDLQ